MSSTMEKSEGGKLFGITGERVMKVYERIGLDWHLTEIKNIKIVIGKREYRITEERGELVINKNSIYSMSIKITPRVSNEVSIL